MNRHELLVLLLMLLFFIEAPLAQTIGNDTDESNQVTRTRLSTFSRLTEIEKSIQELKAKAKQKDIWDIMQIIGSFIIPLAIVWVGHQFSSSLKMTELEREEQRARSEASIRQAELLSTFMKHLMSEEAQERTIAVRAVSLALPEVSEELVMAIGQLDPSKEVKDAAKDSLRIISLKGLVDNKYELFLLYKLYENEELGRSFPYRKRISFVRELEHLYSLGLIDLVPNKTLGRIPTEGNLRKYVKLTDEGKHYVHDRQEHGLPNPRRERNPEFWAPRKKTVIGSDLSMANY